MTRTGGTGSAGADDPASSSGATAGTGTGADPLAEAAQRIAGEAVKLLRALQRIGADPPCPQCRDCPAHRWAGALHGLGPGSVDHLLGVAVDVLTTMRGTLAGPGPEAEPPPAPTTSSGKPRARPQVQRIDITE
ncbi:MAG: hypothetical protein P8Z68_10235 [Kineosporiaceae bacterium]|jgi:hypothetical protein